MSAGTKIQWCYASINFWWGCCIISTGCKFCYAKTMAARLSRGRATWGPTGLRWLRVGEACLALLKLERAAVKKGTRLRVFINSMGDTFEDRRDLDGARKVLFAMASCVPHLDLLLLTKRPENVESLIPGPWMFGEWPDNVWLGFSAENQEAFDSRWQIVQNLATHLFIPCTFCSAEPLVGPLNIETAQYSAGEADEPEFRPLDWLIVGGESGQRARPLDLDWIRSLIVQGKKFEIPVFVKQLGRRPINTFIDGAQPAGQQHVIEPLALKDGHGGEMSDWPKSFQVRELPQKNAMNGVLT